MIPVVPLPVDVIKLQTQAPLIQFWISISRKSTEVTDVGLQIQSMTEVKPPPKLNRISQQKMVNAFPRKQQYFHAVN